MTDKRYPYTHHGPAVRAQTSPDRSSVMADRIDILHELRCQQEIQPKGYVQAVMRRAAEEIERLRVMAHQPPEKHPENCNCIQCVPF